MPPNNGGLVFGPAQKEALQRGFEEFHWDPEIQQSNQIIATIKSVPELHQMLLPWFSRAHGGTKPNNGSITGHYKRQASRYLKQQEQLRICNLRGTCAMCHQVKALECYSETQWKSGVRGHPMFCLDCSNEAWRLARKEFLEARDQG